MVAPRKKAAKAEVTSGTEASSEERIPQSSPEKGGTKDAAPAKRKTSRTTAPAELEPRATGGSASEGRDSEGKAFLVVGVGASAGGLETLKRFLGAVPSNSGMAFVLVQHLDPSHESAMAEILDRHTDMPVRQVVADTAVEPDHVYVIPPNHYLGIEGRDLKLSDRAADMRTPIDFLFRSLAEECREKAVCIVLSGTGSDGALGIQAVKANGGMAMAEDPRTAVYDGMPRAALNTGVVDFVLPVDDMPGTLLRYARHPYVVDGAESKLVAAAPDEQFDAILTLLRNRADYDFRSYKRGTLTRRIERRLGLNHLGSLSEYVDMLRSDADEAGRLFRDLLIGVSSFFRDPEAWEAVEEEVVAPLVRKNENEPVRVWVTGCSSGEEAYSIAMVLSEQFAAAGKPFNAQIFATDIDPVAIERARAGKYPRSIAADVSRQRLDRFFDSDGGNYAVNETLRESVVFSLHSLTNDPPFSRVDLICCRNLLIYLKAEVQSRTLGTFHFALATGGFLFLGDSESPRDRKELFDAVSKTWKIYRKSPRTPEGCPEFPVHSREEPSRSTPRIDGVRMPGRTKLEAAKSFLLDRFAPASVLIDRGYTVVYFHGPTRLYLENPNGEPSRDLSDLCLGGLRNRLRAAVRKASTEGAPISLVANDVRRGDDEIDVRISVEPVLASPKGEEWLLVTFRDEPDLRVDESSAEQGGNGAAGAEEKIARLKYELDLTRQDLQSGIGELETANEEIKASNEEAMSMNEELQSLNEELNAVNADLQEKIDELAATNDDLSNLLGSTEIATIFLDADLRVRRYTPATNSLISLIPSDVGRPVAEIARHFVDDSLLSDARRVLEDETPRENHIADEQGRFLVRRVLPFRTRDNLVDGVVVTFTDISEVRRQSELVRCREKQQAAVAELGRQALSGVELSDLFHEACLRLAEVLDLELTKVLELLPGGEKLLLRAGVGWTEGLVGHGTVDTQLDSQAGYTLESSGPVVVRNLAKEKRFHGPALLLDHDVVSGMSVIIGSDADPWGVLGVHSQKPKEFTVDDVNFLQAVANVLSAAIDRRKGEEALGESEERYRLITDSLPVLISYFDHEFRYRFCNARYEEWFGLEKNEIVGKTVREVIGEAAFESVEADLRLALKGEKRSFERQLEYRNGPMRVVHGNYIPRVRNGEVEGVYVMLRDVTVRHRAQEQLRIFSEELSKTVDERTEELRILSENVPAFFAFVDADLRYRFVNKYLEERFKPPGGEFVGRPVGESISAESYSQIGPLLQSALRGNTEEAELALDVLPDGVRVVRVRFMPRVEADGEVSGVFMLADDITSERRLQQEVLTAAEKQNDRVGRDLHDSICQELTGIGMLAKALSKKLRLLDTGGAQDAEDLVDQINETTQKSRLLARGLSPMVLENRTLAEALRELVENIAHLFSGVRCRFEDRTDGLTLDETIATQLYFITREAVFNAAKHGREPNIGIATELDGGHLVITVTDEGGGSKEAVNEGMGIRSMRYRARTFGGALTIQDNEDNSGLKVVCRVRVVDE